MQIRSVPFREIPSSKRMIYQNMIARFCWGSGQGSKLWFYFRAFWIRQQKTLATSDHPRFDLLIRCTPTLLRVYPALLLGVFMGRNVPVRPITIGRHMHPRVLFRYLQSNGMSSQNGTKSASPYGKSMNKMREEVFLLSQQQSGTPGTSSKMSVKCIQCCLRLMIGFIVHLHKNRIVLPYSHLL